MKKIFPIAPAHPERQCWGCDRYCPADAMACGNGSERTQHPSELFGADWMDWTPPEPQDPAGDAAGMLRASPEESSDGLDYMEELLRRGGD